MTSPEPSEKDMEDAIAANPSGFIQEHGLVLLARQYSIGTFRFDLLFRDRHDAKLIVEIQKGTLDRNHCYKVLDYYDAYKFAHPEEFVDVLVIANNVPAERKRHLSSRGIKFIEIPLDSFRAICAMKREKTVSPSEHIAAHPTPSSTPPCSDEADAYDLFVSQRDAFVESLRGFQRIWFPKLPGKPWNPRTSSPIKSGQRNWFVSFVPESWWTWDNVASVQHGVHYEFGYIRRGGARFRLSIGVELPLLKEYQQRFKEDVADEATRRGLRASWFTLRADPKTKLLEVDAIPLDRNAASIAFGRYRELQPLSGLVAGELRRYRSFEAFPSTVRFHK